MNPPSDSADRSSLRRELRRARAAIEDRQRRRSEQRILHALQATAWFVAGRSLALYVSAGSEVDTWALRRLCHRRGCRLYLPRILDHYQQRMALCRDTGAPLQPNRFGIGEPPPGPALDPALLPLIVLPLLGFDARGTRLGTGAGYYDRLLARLPRERRARRTRLIGLAYDCQRQEHIAAQPHDVPLDGIVTESGLHWFTAEHTT